MNNIIYVHASASVIATCVVHLENTVKTGAAAEGMFADVPHQLVTPWSVTKGGCGLHYYCRLQVSFTPQCVTGLSCKLI